MKDDFSFMDEQQVYDGKDHSLTEKNIVDMQMIKEMHGPIPDSVVEPILMMKYPQLLYPFMYMAIRFIVAVLTVFA